MKTDNRKSRYYNLAIDQGDFYKSSANLIAWQTFDETIISKSELQLSNASGSFLNSGGSLQSVVEGITESPVNLKGLQFLNRTAITLRNLPASPAAFKLSDFAEEINSSNFTVSLTFKLPVQFQNVLADGNDNRYHLLSIFDDENQSGRYSVFYDNDAGGASTQAFSLIASSSTGTAPNDNRWNLSGSNVNTDNLRGWMRLDFVVSSSYNLTTGTPQTWADNEGAAIYLNGELLNASDGTSDTIQVGSQSKFNEIRFGYPGTNAFPGNTWSTAIQTALQISEVAVWNTALNANEVYQLYSNTVLSNNSGLLSNPVGAGSICGDCEHDSYPTVKRPGDQDRLGTRSRVFDENESVINIPSANSTINYPTLLESGSQASGASGFLFPNSNRLPTLYAPNSQTGSLGRANVLGTYKKCHKNLDASDGFKPFNDATFATDIATSKSHMPDIAPGFTDNLGDRIMIEIDITPAEEKILQVVTGVNGETWTDGSTPTDPESTGLAYYNFVSNKFESMGARHAETGEIRNWNLPGEVSSSTAFPPFPPGGYDTETNYPAFQFEDLQKVPRIFQPYSSIVSHRTTFNHVYVNDYRSFYYFQGRAQAYLSASQGVDPWQMENIFSASSITSIQQPIPDFLPYEKGLDAALFGGRGRLDFEWSIYSSDVAGWSWPQKTREASVRAPNSGESGLPGNNGLAALTARRIIWNNPDESDAGPILRFDDDAGYLLNQDSRNAGIFYTNLNKQFKTTLDTIGRPIAYTNWSRSEFFHASSSQQIDLSEYINGPMLLESIEINASVESKRLQKPVYSSSNSSYISDDISLWWNNTNNHIDCLTFFLMRQERPFANNLTGSYRDLITYSNNIFASKYVGWDWWAGFMQGMDPTLPNPRAMTPVGGARTSRVFEVRENDLSENVPGMDTFEYYKTSTGQLQGAWSNGDKNPGVFFANLNETDTMGQYRDDNFSGEKYPGRLLSIVDPKQPIERYVTASHRIQKIIPVRSTTAYAQHDIPILPALQAGPHLTSSSPANTNQFFVYNDSGTNLFISSKGNNAVKPRTLLSCMGRYWPGGTRLSENSLFEQPTPAEAEETALIPYSKDNFTSPLAVTPTGSYQASDYQQTATRVMALARDNSERLFSLPGGLRKRDTIGGQPKIFTDRHRPTVPERLGYTPSSLITPNINNPFYHENAAPPNFVRYDLSGSVINETGYVLFPEDKLIFGAQWSPADAVHRSFSPIKNAAQQLTFAGGGSGPGTVPELTGPAPWDIRTNPAQIGEHAYRFAGYCESNDLSMVASASCTIKSERSTLRLYGTVLKNQRQKQLSLPQQVVNNCVHEAIGNDPVIDQYDFAANSTLLSSPFSTLIEGEPRSGTRSVTRSLKDRNLKDVGHVRRTSRLVDVERYYYDSLVPKIKDMWDVDGFGEIQPIGLNNSGIYHAFAPNFPNITPSVYAIKIGDLTSPTYEPNDAFARSFPFESRYAHVTRSLDSSAIPGYYLDTTNVLMYSSSLDGFVNGANFVTSSTGFTAYEFRGGDTILGLAHQKFTLSKGEGYPTGNNLTAYTNANVFTSETFGVDSPTTKANNNIGFFGFGDNPNGCLDIQNYLFNINKDATPDNIGWAKLSVAKPRGYRYGLISANPHPTSAVFRRDRYGQFRDMFEQRQYSQEYIVPLPISSRSRRSLIRGDIFVKRNRISEPAVKVIFRQPVHDDPLASAEISTKLPEETQSSNLSLFATSSLPFFDDGGFRNRSAEPSDEDIIID